MAKALKIISLIAAVENRQYTLNQLQGMEAEMLRNIENNKHVETNTIKLEIVQNAIHSEYFKDPTEDTAPSEYYIAKKYLQIYNNAISRGKEFNLTMADVKALLNRKTCYYTGKRFVDDGGQFGRTFDRVDSSIGYIKGNVVACTHWANQMKNSLFENSECELYGMADHFIQLIAKVKNDG